MPTHFHWLVKTEPKYGNISDIMRDVKKFTAWKIFDLIELKKLDELENIFIKEAKGIEDQRRKLWIKRFDDQVIRNNKMFWTKLKYIHNNPVKDGLIDKTIDYKYSSAINYIQKDNAVLFVDTSWGGVEII